MKTRSINYSTVGLFILLVGCSSVTRVDHVPVRKDVQQDLVVFFDGTASDESSHTNVAKLHNLVTLQDRNDISTTYIKGVGTGAKAIGMAMGWGVGNDVREAYLYLIENYDQKYQDQISIFGFSRGAYTSRILAALLYVAGIPEEAKGLSEPERKKLVEDIYSAYKSNKKIIRERRSEISEIVAEKWGDRFSYTPKPVNVRFLGLWDTVEAFGIPDYEENINEPNERYADQLCNIEAAAHAMSLDDDRARVFTPLLLTRKHLRDEECDTGQVNNDEKLHEVWFSGAHSDVGGGYKDTDIDGIPLNWMLDMMEDEGLNLVPKQTRVYYNFLGKTHNPEGGLAGLIYRKRNRNIPCYTETEDSEKGLCSRDKDDPDYRSTSTASSKPLNVHQSVLDRLCVKTPEAYESFWFREKKYENCLLCDELNKGKISEEKRCQERIKPVINRRYKKRAVTAGDNYCDYSVCRGAINKPYSMTKSCNYFQDYIAERAAQRLAKEYLLEQGQKKTIVFYADVKNDHTGVFLSKKRSYRFSIDYVENWVDCTVERTTPQSGRATWTPGANFFNNVINFLAKPIAYVPSRGYMELLGEVAGEQFLLGHLAHNGTPYSPENNGELILRVNEPRFLDTVYANNFGVVKLVIEVK